MDPTALASLQQLFGSMGMFAAPPNLTLPQMRQDNNGSPMPSGAAPSPSSSTPSGGGSSSSGGSGSGLNGLMKSMFSGPKPAAASGPLTAGTMTPSAGQMSNGFRTIGQPPGALPLMTQAQPLTSNTAPIAPPQPAGMNLPAFNGGAGVVVPPLSTNTPSGPTPDAPAPNPTNIQAGFDNTAPAPTMAMGDMGGLGGLGTLGLDFGGLGGFGGFFG